MMPNPGSTKVAASIQLDAGNFRETVDALATGRISLDRTAVPDLFSLAKVCVCNGAFALRDQLYDLVARHPDATPEDKVRVVINTADNARRTRTEDGALSAIEMISGIQGTFGTVTEAEKRQVVAQAQLVLFGLHQGTRPSHASEHATYAVREARDILELAARADMPLDRQVFYHQSFVGIKQAVGQRDEEMQAVDRKYHVLMEQMQPDAIQQRELSQAHATTAGIAQAERRYSEAFENWVTSYRLGSGAYYKIGGAMAALTLIAEQRVAPAVGLGDELLKYVISAIPELEPAQRKAAQPEIDALRRHYAEIPS